MPKATIALALLVVLMSSFAGQIVVLASASSEFSRAPVAGGALTLSLHNDGGSTQSQLSTGLSIQQSAATPSLINLASNRPNDAVDIAVVQVTAIPAGSATLDPSTGWAKVTISVILQNLGSTQVSTDVYVTIVDTGRLVSKQTLNLNPGSTSYDFVWIADQSDVGTHTIQVSVSTIGDNNPSNDAQSIPYQIIASPGPTQQNFDFSISVSPGSGVVDAGKALTPAGTVILTLLSGSTQSVSLSLSGLPSNVGVDDLNGKSCSPTCQIDFGIGTFPAGSPGFYILTITGTGGDQQHSTTYTLTVNSPPLPPQQSFDFSISVSPSGGSIEAGKALTPAGTVILTLLSSSPSSVSLSLSGLPASVGTDDLTGKSCSPSCQIDFGIGTYSGASPGSYSLTITGTGGGQQHSTTFMLTVTAPQQQGCDFSISVSPNSGSVDAGNALTPAGTVTALGGCSESVTLSLSGLPSSVGTDDLTGKSCTPSCSIDFGIGTYSGAPSGTYSLIITGTGGGKTHSTTFTLTVKGTSPPTRFDFSISVSPSSISIDAGKALTPAGTVHLTLTKGSPQSVSLSIFGLPSNVGTEDLTGKSCTPTCQIDFGIGTYSGAPAETYSLTIIGTGGGQTHSTTFTLTVKGPPPPTGFDFSISVSPSSGSVDPGKTLALAGTVYLTLISGLTQSVTLSLKGLPSTVGTEDLSGKSCSPTCQIDFGIGTYSTATPGTYTLTITGNGGGQTHSTTFYFTVNGSQPPQQDNAQIIAFDPPTGNFNRGDSLTARVRIRNTGATTRIFWVGLSYQKPDGSYYDVPPQQTGTIAPQQEESLTFTWSLPLAAPEGQYGALTAAWNSYNPQINQMIGPKFDQKSLGGVFVVGSACQRAARIHVQITRYQFYSKIRGPIANVQVSATCSSDPNLLTASFDVTNTRSAMYTIDVYTGAVFQYSKTVFIDENGVLDFTQDLHRYANDGFFVKMDVNVALSFYLVQYIFSNILNFSPSDDTLWAVIQEVKREFFPDQPFLMTDPLSWVTSFANYLKEHPDEFVKLAIESGLSYTVNKIIEKASVISSVASTIVDTVQLTVKALASPAEEAIQIVLTDSGQSASAGSVLALNEQAHKLYLHVYDEQNRHVGISYQTNSIDMQIPGATYADYPNGVVITLPNAVASFRISIDAKSAEEPKESYNLTMAIISNGQALNDWNAQASIAKGGTATHQVLLIQDEQRAIVDPSVITVIWYRQRLLLLSALLIPLILGGVILYQRQVLVKRGRRIKEYGLVPRRPVCPKCGFVNKPGAAYCTKDGTRLSSTRTRPRISLIGHEQAMNVCTQCGFVNRPGTRFCAKDRTVLSVEARDVPRMDTIREVRTAAIACPTCGHLNRPSARFCIMDRTALPSTVTSPTASSPATMPRINIVCTKCGTHNRPEAGFCKHCRTSLR